MFKYDFNLANNVPDTPFRYTSVSESDRVGAATACGVDSLARKQTRCFALASTLTPPKTPPPVPATGTGIVLPSIPPDESPHEYTVPSLPTKYDCFCPADADTTVTPLSASMRCGAHTTAGQRGPRPSSPWSLHPNEYTVPSCMTAIEK